MEEKEIFVMYAEKGNRSAIVPFEDGKRAVEFFKKHGVIIQRIKVNDMNDTRAELEGLEELQTISEEK